MITEEEFLKYARENGYYVSKKPERKIKLLPCICGAKQIRVIRNGRKRKLRCPKCGKQTLWFENPELSAIEIENDARVMWNEMMEEESENESRSDI